MGLTHSAQKFLTSLTVADVLGKAKPMVRLTTGTPLLEVFKVLSANGILSAPVIDPQRQKYHGFVDVLDLIGYLHLLAREKGVLASSLFTDEFFLTPVEVAMERYQASKSPRHPIVEVPKTRNLLEVFDLMYKQHVHRIAVTDDEVLALDHVVGVLTQSDIIRFLYQHVDQLEDPNFMFAPHKTMAHLGFGGPSDKKVVTVLETDNTFDSFVKLHELNISALGIVDAEGKLTGSLSAGDLRGITRETLNTLSLSVKDFLASPALPVSKRGFAVVHMHTHFRDVLKLLNDRHLHRVFLVNKETKPLTVIALSDILNLFTIGLKPAQ